MTNQSNPDFYPKQGDIQRMRHMLPHPLPELEGFYEEGFVEDNPGYVHLDNELLAVAPFMYFLPPTEIPGITPADALDANDQMGALFRLRLPATYCTIMQALYHDLDNEGTGIELWLFGQRVTLAASDAAFALIDSDNLNVIAPPLTFSAFKTATNNQIGVTVDTPVDVFCPGRNLYMAVKTLSTPNIAALNQPRISMVVRRNNEV